MASIGYTIQSASAALTASATKTVVVARAGATFGIQALKWGVSFDGSAAAAGIQCQLVYVTFATGTPGTNSTTITPLQMYGRVLAHGMTAAGHWTTEPTVVTVLESKYIQQSGAYEWAIPLGKEPETAFSEGLGVRVITPAAVTPNCSAFIQVERV